MEKNRSSEPPAGLAPAILKRIAEREVRMLRLKAFASLSLFLGSAYFIIAASLDLFAELTHSGFFDLASLPISDFTSTFANFPEFVLSIADAFPFFAAAVVLGGIAIAVVAVASFFDEIAMIRARKQLIIR